MYINVNRDEWVFTREDPNQWFCKPTYRHISLVEIENERRLVDITLKKEKGKGKKKGEEEEVKQCL